MKHWDFKNVASKEKFWKSIHLFYFSAEAKIICYSILQIMRYGAGYIMYSLIGKHKRILGPILTIVF